MKAFLMHLIRLYVFTNIHISLIGALLSFLISRYFDIQLPIDFFGLLFFSILCYYSLHWGTQHSVVIETREIWSTSNQLALKSIAFIAFSISVFLMIQHVEWLIYFIPTGLAGILYTFFSKWIFFKLNPRFKALFISIFWTYTLIIIPFLLNKSSILWSFEFIIISLFILFYTFSISLEFELRDLLKNEFGFSSEELFLENYKLKKLKTELFFSLTVLIILVFSINYITALFLMISWLFLYLNQQFSKQLNNWLKYDLLLDLHLLLPSIIGLTAMIN